MNLLAAPLLLFVVLQFSASVSSQWLRSEMLPTVARACSQSNESPPGNGDSLPGHHVTRLFCLERWSSSCRVPNLAISSGHVSDGFSLHAYDFVSSTKLSRTIGRVSCT
ncbi:uncharacterized protein LY79DRAFT_26894 [Colletotrichum navitas]|uniref:Secreted protein n=1 Tax=Colletotrichum navitas TaxID=681940 RepID=A0AAD8QDI0_9PEZI|nr:uncharacterized protein LY79DRAFT_26894 [Colletotrichum navitas]KAK1600653.1 hypothetical protein LY79DRAFT_26894 [Colletotrichum navitas]